MNNKRIFFVLIVLLFLVIVFETAYIMKTHRGRRAMPAQYGERCYSTKAGSRPHQIQMQFAWPVFSDEANTTAGEWEPFKEMERIQHQMNRMFKDSFEKAARDKDFEMLGGKSFFEPDMDIKDTGSDYVVNLDVPGLNKDEINIELKGPVLTVSGERKNSVEENSQGMVRNERSFGYFARTITLPENIKHESINADYQNGVLSITIPKLTNTKTEQHGTKIKVA